MPNQLLPATRLRAQAPGQRLGCGQQGAGNPGEEGLLTLPPNTLRGPEGLTSITQCGLLPSGWWVVEVGGGRETPPLQMPPSS